ncbi:MAG: nucleotidyltransferase family protein, partial [Dehalococcoidia bacterium]
MTDVAMPRAVLLAAGYGTRLGGLTADLPKPMIDVGGRPLLEQTVRGLAAQGVREFGINLHFRGDLIRAHFGDGRHLGVSITYREEPELLGTAGALRGFTDWLREGGGPFLVQYGDVITDQAVEPILDLHRRRGALLTLLVHERERSNSVVVLDGEGRVTTFLERPDEATRAAAGPSRWVFSGVCVADLDALDAIPASGAVDLP